VAGSPSCWSCGASLPGYEYNPYGYAPYASVNPFDSRSTTVLVLGILGLVVCGFLGVAAWIMGRNLKNEAEAAGYPEPGNCKAGRICGMVATGLLVVGLAFFLLFVLAAGLSTPR
jgi:hypothetical protein